MEYLKSQHVLVLHRKFLSRDCPRYTRVKVTSHGQVRGSLLPDPCVGSSDEHRLPVQGHCGVTHSSGCIFPVSHTHTHNDMLMNKSHTCIFPRTGAGCFHSAVPSEGLDTWTARLNYSSGGQGWVVRAASRGASQPIAAAARCARV